MISNRIAIEGESSTKKKTFIRSIYNVKTEPKRPNSSLLTIFLNKNLKGIQTTHDNPIVVLVMITNFEIWKILVDNGNVVDIFFYESF